MQRTEVARFSDPQEAQIAAGALRAAGFDTEVEISSLASIDPLLRTALGGFPVRVANDEAEAAGALLAGWRTENPEALEWRRHPQVFSGLPLALTAADPVLAMTLAAGRGQASLRRRTAAAVIIAVIGLLLIAIVALALASL